MRAATRGLTLVEGLMVLALFSLVAVLLFTHLRQATRFEKGAGREAEYTLQRALLASILSADIHSSTEVERCSPTEYRIKRWVDRGSQTGQVSVSYRVDPEARTIVRDAEGETPRVFDFSQFLDDKLKMKLELEKIEEPQ